MAALENAPPATIADTRRAIVSNLAALRDLCAPLGPRLGLLQVRSAAEWSNLARVAPQLGPCPDLRSGMLIGLACWAGTPVDGQWPVHINAVTHHEGAGLVEAEFHGGSYLPDGRVCLEIVHVRTRAVVLAVTVNGAAFYPP